MVLNAYKQHAPILKAALEDIILTVKQNVETHEESLWQNTELD